MTDLVECEQNEQTSMLMSLALDGLLDENGQRRIEGHLAACPACRQEWEAMQQTAAWLEDSPLIGPPLGFAVRVERQLAEKTRKRRRLFGGVAVLTSSLSLAGVTLTMVVLFGLALLAWQQFGSLSSVQQGTNALSHVASGMGLMGKGAGLFLGDLLLRYGPLLILVVGIGLVVLIGLWFWLFVKRPGGHHNNGYA